MPILSSFAGLSAKALGFFYNLRLTWSKKSSLSTSLTIRKAIYAPLGAIKFFLFGGSIYDNGTDRYYYSSDGLTWTAGTLPIGTVYADTWNTAGYNGTTLVATTDKHIDYTTDGINWTVVKECEDGDGYDYTTTKYLIYPSGGIIWNGTNFIMGGSRSIGDVDPDTDEPEYISYYTYYSTDGQTWTGTNALDNIRIIGYSPATGKYFGAKTRFFSIYYYICDSNPLVESNWDEISMPSSDYNNVKYGNGLYLATTGEGTEYATSTDGTTWTERTLPVTQNGTISFVAGKFRFYSADKIYASTNGIDWVVEKTFSSSTLDKVISWVTAGNIVYGFGQRDDNNDPDGTNDIQSTSTYLYGV